MWSAILCACKQQDMLVHVSRLSSRQQAQQRGLAHAIGAGQAVPPPRRDGHVRVLQQHLALHPHRQAVHLPDYHAYLRTEHGTAHCEKDGKG